MKKEFDYRDVIDLGFKRKELDDSLFFNEHGFGCFIVQKKVSNKIHFDWDCLTGEVNLIRTNKEGFITSKLLIKDLDELKRLLEFYFPNEFKNLETENISFMIA